MALNKRLAAAAFGVLAMGGIGAGVANAATTNTAPPPSTSAVDTPTPGDTVDAPSAADTLTPGDTADVPTAPGATSTQQDAQNGNQAGAEVEDAPGGAPEAGN
jgi:hypothetical protein